MVGHASDVFPGVAEVRKMISDGVEAVLVGRPGDGVGDSFPGVGVGAAPHVVASLGNVARVRDAVLIGLNSICCLVPRSKGMFLVTYHRYNLRVIPLSELVKESRVALKNTHFVSFGSLPCIHSTLNFQI